MDVTNFDIKAFLADPSTTVQQKMAIFQQVIDAARAQKRYLVFRTTAGPTTNHIRALSLETGEPREMIMMASNNYLGLTNHPTVVARTKAVIDEWGIGMAGPCTLNGNTTLHQAFEADLAAFKGCEAAMVFASGYAANIGCITALLGPDDVFIGDELNHASLIDGARYSRAKRVVFKHSDPEDLERCLREVDGRKCMKLVAVDGVYSMDGEIAPLRPIVDQCRKYGATLLVDDAHGTGAVGEHGHGAAEYCGVQGEIDIVMGTFSKSFGCYGGFIAGSRELINWLRHFGRAGMFTAAVSPMVIAACHAGLDVMKTEPQRLARLRANADRMRSGLQRMGYNTGRSVAPIIPLYIGSRDACYGIVYEAYERGLFLSLIEYPAVAPGTERIRLTVSATHTDEDLEQALALLAELGRKYGVLR